MEIQSYGISCSYLQYAIVFSDGFPLHEMSILGVKTVRFLSLVITPGAVQLSKEYDRSDRRNENMEIIGSPLDIRSSLRADREAELDSLADAITNSMVNE